MCVCMCCATQNGYSVSARVYTTFVPQGGIKSVEEISRIQPRVVAPLVYQAALQALGVPSTPMEYPGEPGTIDLLKGMLQGACGDGACPNVVILDYNLVQDVLSLPMFKVCAAPPAPCIMRVSGTPCTLSRSIGITFT
jgi:hypothetical protein